MRKAALHNGGSKAHGVLSDCVGDATLAAVPLGRPRYAIGQGQAHHLLFEVDNGVHDVVSMLERGRKTADVLRGVAGIEPGEEHRRAQRVRKARRVVMEGLSRRQLVGSIQLQGEAARDHGRYLCVSARAGSRLLGRSSRLRAAGGKPGEGKKGDEEGSRATGHLNHASPPSVVFERDRDCDDRVSLRSAIIRACTQVAQCCPSPTQVRRPAAKASRRGAQAPAIPRRSAVPETGDASARCGMRGRGAVGADRVCIPAAENVYIHGGRPVCRIAASGRAVSFATDKFARQRT